MRIIIIDDVSLCNRFVIASPVRSASNAPASRIARSRPVSSRTSARHSRKAPAGAGRAASSMAPWAAVRAEQEKGVAQSTGGAGPRFCGQSGPGPRSASSASRPCARSKRATSFAASPFCGPNTAVATRSPQSGMSTPESRVMSRSRRRRSSPEKSTPASFRSPSKPAGRSHAGFRHPDRRAAHRAPWLCSFGCAQAAFEGIGGEDDDHGPGCISVLLTWHHA